MPKPPEQFAVEIMNLCTFVVPNQVKDELTKAIRDRDFQIVTSTSDKIGGTE